ncbi:MAG: MBOAT family protein, partial [Deltaproteobacteria bacterium]
MPPGWRAEVFVVMLFCEPLFLFAFLPICLLVYHASPQRLRNLVLCGASLLFYAVGEWRFVPFLLASVALNYALARLIERWRGRRGGGALLALGIISDLALLFVFKYSAFFVQNFNVARVALGSQPWPVPQLALPLGLSFFTFHKISYKVDVYRGVAQARRSALDLCLYILVFPQLIAGPIIRYHDIADQLRRRLTSLEDMAEGARRFTIGLGKKMLLANPAALCADQIFGTPGLVGLPSTELRGQVAWLAACCYSLQIYFDFSGYSDMAIGLGRMFGFTFPENFAAPYQSTSVTDFWRRWHISLSRWFRDYLYIPLGGNRAAPWRVYANLATVFVLC